MPEAPACCLADFKWDRLGSSQLLKQLLQKLYVCLAKAKKKNQELNVCTCIVLPPMILT